MTLAQQKRLDSWLNIIILGAVLVGLMLNMGVNALYLEEPRRAMVGLEMVLNDNYFVPTYYGEFYYRKPPIFNWTLLASFKAFGTTEWAARLVTVLSLIGMGFVNFRFVRKWSDRDTAWYSSMFMICGAIYLYFMSMFAEIDMFYCLISYSGMIAMYHFYRKDQPYLMFIMVYGLGAIGLLTKGLPSIPFIGLTIGSFVLWKRNWRQVFGLPHLAGIAVFAVIVGGYLYIYSQYNTLENYWGGVWGEASGRTMIGQTWVRLLRHIFEFPIATLIDIAPVGFFALFLLRKGAFKRLFKDDLMAFCGIVWLANFLLYWSAPGAKGVYVMMLDPFLVILCTRLYLNEAHQVKWISPFMRGFNVVLLGVITLGMIAAPFIEFLAPVSGLLWQSIAFTVGMIGIWWLWWKSKGQVLKWLILALLLGRIGFDIIALPMRAWDGRHTRFKEDSMTIADISGDETVRVWGTLDEGAFAHHFAFYLEREKEEILWWSNERACDAYFLGLERDQDPAQVEVFHRFRNWNHDYIMFKFNDCGGT